MLTEVSDSCSNHGNKAEAQEEANMCAQAAALVDASVQGSVSVRNILNASKHQAHLVLLSHHTFADSLLQPQVNIKQGNSILPSQDRLFFPEMCLIFKDVCPNVLKTDPPPRHISTTSISEIPGQSPDSHTIFIFTFIFILFIFMSFYLSCICVHNFLIY